eukprot:gene12649-16958_t
MNNEYLIHIKFRYDITASPCVTKYNPCFANCIEVDRKLQNAPEIIYAIDDDLIPEINRGTAFTSIGPSPYVGNILDHPDLLWTDDHWDDDREEEAKVRLEEQDKYGKVSKFWKEKYINSAGVYWHDFYKRNTDQFYKDRHYLHIVFPELKYEEGSPSKPSDYLRLLEVGCGVGNAVLPLLSINPFIHIIAMDFAKSAINILNQNELYLTNKYRMETYTKCIVNDDLPIANNSIDISLCMFVLSAISPDNQKIAINKLSHSLKTGGKILIRDYGRYDEAQLRFKKGSKLDDNFYVRQDGTCSYFFTLEEIDSLCVSAGLRCEESYYIRRQYANRQQKKARFRVWIHAKYVKI